MGDLYCIYFCAFPPLNSAHAQYTKYKHPNCTNHGQHMHLIQIQQQVLGSSAGTKMVVTCAKFGLLAVAAFLELSNMPTAD